MKENGGDGGGEKAGRRTMGPTRTSSQDQPPVSGAGLGEV